MPNTARKSRGRPDRLQIFVTNTQSVHAVDAAQLMKAARAVLKRSMLRTAAVSVAIVDDATIHDLNRRYLSHDWPTDVLSFLLDEGDGHLEGEVVISADTAAAVAAELGWPASAEQLLYVIHGMLHLVGYRDEFAGDAAKMRAAESALLHEFGLIPPYATPRISPTVEATHDRLQAGASAR
jgi:probable rRNA maturation factor